MREVGIAGAHGNAVGHSVGADEPREIKIIILSQHVRDAQDNLLPIVETMGKNDFGRPMDGRRSYAAIRVFSSRP